MAKSNRYSVICYVDDDEKPRAKVLFDQFTSLLVANHIKGVMLIEPNAEIIPKGNPMTGWHNTH